jgi:hypothetical protein
MMPRLWPRRLPKLIRDNPLRAAEVKVFDRLALELDEHWTVFYSRPWLGLTAQGEEVDGEADFLLAHADHGLLSIEIKGGRIDWDPQTELWTSTDRWGVTHPIKDPVGQAKSAKHEMVKRLRGSQHWKSRWVRARHGVIFPDTEVPDRNFGTDRPRKIFCDRKEFGEGLADWISTRLASEDLEEKSEAIGPGLDGLRALEKLLAEPLHFRVPLGHFLEEDDRALGLLTEEQFHLLDTMEDQGRIVIRGGAGTGKTVLATESARRRALAGDRTLYLCFNRGLSVHEKAALEESGAKVQTFHSLCREYISEAGLRVPDVDEGELHENVLPELLVTALESLPDKRFDVVIVDEAQDFRQHWWPAVDMLLATPDCRLQIFFDANQNFYDSGNTLAVDLAAQPWRLSRNLRNTDPIHNATMRFYDGLPVRPSQVKGEPPEFTRLDLNNLDLVGGTIMRRLRKLIESDSVPANEIAVLVSTSDYLSRLNAVSEIANAGFRACDSKAEDSPVLDTVRRFKGLEARVVLVLADAALLERSDLPYVALSRARALLVILGEPAALAYMANGTCS